MKKNYSIVIAIVVIFTSVSLANRESIGIQRHGFIASFHQGDFGEFTSRTVGQIYGQMTENENLKAVIRFCSEDEFGEALASGRGMPGVVPSMLNNLGIVKKRIYFIVSDPSECFSGAENRVEFWTVLNLNEIKSRKTVDASLIEMKYYGIPADDSEFLENIKQVSEGCKAEPSEIFVIGYYENYVSTKLKRNIKKAKKTILCYCKENRSVQEEMLRWFGPSFDENDDITFPLIVVVKSLERK